MEIPGAQGAQRHRCRSSLTIGWKYERGKEPRPTYLKTETMILSRS